MRQIEFRAYNKEYGMRKLYGFNENFVFLDSLDSPDNTVLPRKEWILMQFTGLTDKNGKKVFEGDIIKVNDDYEEYGMAAGEIYEIYFAYGGFRMKPKFRKRAKGYYAEDGNDFEILGNIYENPELLKEEKQNGLV